MNSLAALRFVLSENLMALIATAPPFPHAAHVRWAKACTVKNFVLLFTFLPLFLSGCATSPRTERTTDLGFGFRQIVLTEPSASSFESSGHFEYLYYRNRRLCQLGDCSVSPSGRYAIYQDGPSGNLFLFRRADGRLTQLTSQFVALVDAFEWQEDANTVEARFTGGHEAQMFALQ